MSSVYRPTYVSASDLHALLSSPSKRARTLVVDVRDDDVEGGHVAGSLNVPSRSFGAAVADVREAAHDKDLVVFHCMFSQQRGPACAAHMASAVRASEAAATGDDAKFPPIVILEGGFGGWAKYVARLSKEERAKGAPLIEKYDKNTHGFDIDA